MGGAGRGLVRKLGGAGQAEGYDGRYWCGRRGR